MDLVVRRAPRVFAVICLVIGLLSFALPANGGPLRMPERLTLRGDRSPLYAVPAKVVDTPKPLTLYLHGICGDPSNGCAAFAESVTDASWLLCPSAPTACPGGGGTWSAPTETLVDALHRAEVRALEKAPESIDATRPRVLIGFSQGGYRVVDLLRAEPGRYRSALVIGADVKFSKRSLEKAGVRRVALGAGRYDMTFRAMRKTAEALAHEGFPVRFVDLGRVGHTYVPEPGSESLYEALAWLEAVE